eukprot:jgi/Botrbrau1/11244/Bobra.0038s0016.1
MPGNPYIPLHHPPLNSCMSSCSHIHTYSRPQLEGNGRHRTAHPPAPLDPCRMGYIRVPASKLFLYHPKQLTKASIFFFVFNLFIRCALF